MVLALTGIGDHELKKSMFPSASGGPPKETFTFSCSPWKSITFFQTHEQISICSFHRNQYSKEHSGRLSEGTPFYVHHLYTISISLFPTPNKTIISEEPEVSRTRQVVSRRHWTPNFQSPWSRKMTVPGTTTHPSPTQMTSMGHALMAMLLTAHCFDSYKWTPPNPTSTFYGRLSALWEILEDLSINWQQSPTSHRIVCADTCIVSHTFSVVLNISPREPAASLPTSLK